MTFVSRSRRSVGRPAGRYLPLQDDIALWPTGTRRYLQRRSLSCQSAPYLRSSSCEPSLRPATPRHRALGCIGSWIVRDLVRQGARVTTYDLDDNPHRMKLIMTPDELSRVTFARGDITDLDALLALAHDSGVTSIIHLAALQVPACKANPSLGARINVVGTVNVFETARRLGLDRIVYASSVATYGGRENYAQSLIQPDDPLMPKTLYGVYKQANEATARVYWADWGVSSIGLRPYVLYGPGRDQGMTSTPTKAMLAAAAGLPYRITYGGRSGMQYTDDVARAFFIAVTSVPFEGAEVYNIRGFR